MSKKSAAVPEAAEKLIRARDMIPAGASVLCAVSGGADSVCLLHVLYGLREKLGFTLAAAHYDHNLRGEESRRDARFVADFTARRCPGVPLYSGSGDVRGEAERRRANVEETAREMRYAFLRETARTAGADKIAVAHTAGDNAETVLFHLARGSGLRGLTGIAPVSGEFIRPLLTSSREEVEAYLDAHSLPHVEDSTNRDDAYARNRIRHRVIPVLEELFPGVCGRIAETAARLQADEDFLEAQAALVAGWAVREEDRILIPAALIGEAPGPLAVRAVRQLIGELRGGDRDCAAAHLEAVVRLCAGDGPSASADLPGDLTARREYERLVLTRGGGQERWEEKPLLLPGVTGAGPWRIACTRERYAGQPQGPWEFWLDQEKIPALMLRPRAAGDRLRLAGRPEKTLKKWMIEEKIPRAEREGLPVFDCGNSLAAAAGLGADAAFLPRQGRPAWRIIIQNRKEAAPK